MSALETTQGMTGFDPTAPDRETDDDEAERVPGNVVPPESLEDDGPIAGTAPQPEPEADETG